MIPRCHRGTPCGTPRHPRGSLCPPGGGRCPWRAAGTAAAHAEPRGASGGQWHRGGGVPRVSAGTEAQARRAWGAWGGGCRGREWAWGCGRGCVRVRRWAQWEGGTGTWTQRHGMGLGEMGTEMWAQSLGTWHRVRTGHNEAGPWLGDGEDMGTMKGGTGTWIQCLGMWHRAWRHGPRA